MGARSTTYISRCPPMLLPLLLPRRLDSADTRSQGRPHSTDNSPAFVYSIPNPQPQRCKCVTVSEYRSGSSESRWTWPPWPGPSWPLRE
ncbi:hypothetical protein BJ875DRAFT_455972 [Amylocarpus encephaloides]|uniref:Uncharacterized protein n=1 Tax=Amylocarpus encephaloides TaxID=45428 RepID=A0A9P8C7T7_9HELO|nr:hypothetical protein BJ875DRAFT_455972 [Amylocarpus encephaloides]